MKILLSALLAFLLVPVFAGCSGQEEKSYTIAEPGSWRDGTYTAQADGYNGSFSVSVTISDGHISAIDADSHNETPDRGGVAIETMIPSMIDGQTYDVDTTSGATITGDALRDAVARCLEEASAQ